MGNCNCCEEEPTPTVTTGYPHQNANPPPFNHHLPPTYPNTYPTYPNTYPTYPTAPPSTCEPPPVANLYPPLPPQVELISSPNLTGPSYFWSASSFGGVHPQGIKAGTDKSGEDIFIGRAYHEGDALPAKIVPSHRCAYVAWGGREYRKDHYDVLCGQSSSWHSGRHGEVPEDAVTCGQTSDGETLFVGRVFHDGTLTPGKIHPSHGVIYIPYNGEELSFQEYEVLVVH